MSKTAIETYTGRYFDYAAPRSEDICIEDIARSLSNTARFRGHTSRFYSVAEHCVLVRQLVIEAGRPDLGLAALLHDAHEAYVGDVPTPLKGLLGESFRDLVGDLDAVICDAVAHEMPSVDLHAPMIIAADARCLRHEAAVLKPSFGTGEHWGFEYPAARDGFVKCWDSRRAELEFLDAYRNEVEP